MQLRPAGRLRRRGMVAQTVVACYAVPGEWLTLFLLAVVIYTESTGLSKALPGFVSHGEA